jgi:hypothetical protein
MELGRYFYLIDYRSHYGPLPTFFANPALAIAELFLFRAWVTQFGFRIFSSYPQISEDIINRTIMLTSTLGRAMLAQAYGIRFESLFSSDFIELLDSRWNEYDSVIARHQSEQHYIGDAVANHCSFNNPIIQQMSLIVPLTIAADYALQLKEIESEAIQRRIYNK